MKLLTPFAAIIAAAAAGQVFTTQPAESYAKSAEIYQSELEYQQQGLYSDQSHHPNVDQSHTSYNADHGYGQRPSGEREARILSLVSERDEHGYHYAYETENGIKAQETGQISHDKGTETHGGFSYTGDDGHVYTVTYTADEHGFHAQGAHLPTPPPIPEAIAKSLEQNAREEAAGIYDDGKYVEQHQAQYQENQQLHPTHQEMHYIQQHLPQTQQQYHQTQQHSYPAQDQLHQPLQHLHQTEQHLHQNEQHLHQAQQLSHPSHLQEQAFQQGGHDGYHTLNVPGYHKH